MGEKLHFQNFLNFLKFAIFSHPHAIFEFSKRFEKYHERHVYKF